MLCVECTEHYFVIRETGSAILLTLHKTIAGLAIFLALHKTIAGLAILLTLCEAIAALCIVPSRSGGYAQLGDKLQKTTHRPFQNDPICTVVNRENLPKIHEVEVSHVFGQKKRLFA